MKNQKLRASLLAAAVLATTILPGAATTVSAAPAKKANSDIQFVNLDGEWNYKLYRTYGQMFQYQPFGMCPVTWEDNEIAVLPDKATFSEWETTTMPYVGGDAGGLLPLEHEDGSTFVPKWSETWVCRTFTVPADFTSLDEVTLLMGIIDDADVIYINGQAVAGSGFKNIENVPTINDLALGGFDGKNLQFEKSYWEVEREYKIPASILNMGGENEIAIRLFNNNGNGGFYAGRTYALCSSDLAVRAAKGLATEDATKHPFQAGIDAQIKAIEAGDMNAFAATIADDYSNDGVDKAGRVAEVAALLEGCTDIQVTDEKPGFYEKDGIQWYNAIRTITATKGEETVTVCSAEIEVAYTKVKGKIVEYGNHSHCYASTYDSALFDQKLGFGIYLPPSYYTSSQSYPTVVLLHGINSSSSSFINVDNIESFMNKLIADGKVQEMIVLMPDSGKNSFYNDSKYDPANHDTTGPWRSQVLELVDYIDANYRTIDDPSKRGITGISMGGGGSLDLGCSYPEYFSSVASHMGHLPAAKQEALRAMSPEMLAKYDFYVDCGLQDIMVDYRLTVQVHEYLESMGKEHGYDLRDGGHNSAFYMSSMDRSMIMHSDHFKGETSSEETTKPGKKEKTPNPNKPVKNK